MLPCYKPRLTSSSSALSGSRTKLALRLRRRHVPSPMFLVHSTSVCITVSSLAFKCATVCLFFRLDAFFFCSPPSQGREGYCYSTILPAVKYPVVQISGYNYNTGEGEDSWEYVLDEWRLDHHNLFCAGPRFIKTAHLAHHGGGHRECKTDWPTAYSKQVMEKPHLADKALSASSEGSKGIPIAMHHGE